MDADRFDALARTLTPGSRRSFLGALTAVAGSVLAPLLARDDAAAHDLSKKCKKIKDKKKKKACVKKAKKHNATHAVASPTGGGSDGSTSPTDPCLGETAACPASASCCGGLFCGDNTCRPMGSCTVQGATCTGGAAACCTGVCNEFGSTTGPLTATANACALCRSGGAPCEADPDTCCAPRSCTAGESTNNQCCSLLGERCVVLPGDDEVGTCCAIGEGNQDGTRCNMTGPTTGTCCVATGFFAPGNCPDSGENAGCCSGTCSSRTGNCL